jgi:hypothetical protein
MMSTTRHRHHSPEEILAKLDRAAQLAQAGKLQTEIAEELGVSVMTLHRWRKPRRQRTAQTGTQIERGYAARERAIAELQLENSRLRRLVVDLLLEKARLEEEVGQKITQRET